MPAAPLGCNDAFESVLSSAALLRGVRELYSRRTIVTLTEAHALPPASDHDSYAGDTRTHANRRRTTTTTPNVRTNQYANTHAQARTSGSASQEPSGAPNRQPRTHIVTLIHFSETRAETRSQGCRGAPQINPQTPDAARDLMRYVTLLPLKIARC